MNLAKKRTCGVLLMAALLIIVVITSIHLGTVPIPLGGAFHEFLVGAGLSHESLLTPDQQAVFWFIRLPRIVVGLLVGAALAAAGAVMQGYFPIRWQIPASSVSLPVLPGRCHCDFPGPVVSRLLVHAAFCLCGAFLAVAVIVLLAMEGGRTRPVTLLLSGVAMSMFLGALTSGILTFMNEYRLKEFLFWMVGGLDYRRWEHVWLAAGPILIGLIILFLLARHLNVLVLGDNEARALGLPVMFYRLLFLFLASSSRPSPSA